MVLGITILSLAIGTHVVCDLMLKPEAILPMISSSQRTKSIQHKNIQVINLTTIKPTFHQYVNHGNIIKRTKNEHKRFN